MRQFGISNLSVVPVRLEPSERSEQVSQLLFGETFEVIENNGKWSRIICSFDEYEGWIDNKQFAEIKEEDFPQYNPVKPFVCIDEINPANIQHQKINLLPGSSLPKFDGLHASINANEYRFFGKAVEAGSSAVEHKIEEIAKMYMNAPYLWGGRSLFGIDCSGFVQVIFKILGRKLKRDAYQQAEQGTLVNFFEEAKLGDLAFFDNEEERIVHVGMVLDQGHIIHASGKVRIDVFDHQGIFNSETRRYSHKLRIIKRIL
jgi:gamma-D-glutamyl-L-lysine dipeptidyl-peptidase